MQCENTKDAASDRAAPRNPAVAETPVYTNLGCGATPINQTSHPLIRACLLFVICSMQI